MKQSLTQSVTSRVLLALTLALASFVGFTGIAEAATCTSCHATPGQATDIRPVDSGFRNITTGGFKGSHVKHIPAATLDANACTSCHGPGAASYDTRHRNGFINVTSATGVGYSKGTSFAQSGAKTPVLGSCSAASCHSNPYGTGTVTTPVWGTPAANCTACHTTPIGTNGPDTGSHTTTAGHKVACTSCHAAGTSATSLPSSSTHNDGNINIVNVGYPATVAKHAAGSDYTSCSTASCHVDPYSAGTVVTPVWGASAGCTACHTAGFATTGPATGSHVKHNNTDCSQCHAGATNSTTVPSANHADGSIQATGGYPVTAKHAAGTYTGTCSTATCHANVYGTGTVATPVWGSTGNGCNACHTTPIGTTGPATGSHAKHGVTDCSQCHTGATDSATIPSANHADGNIDVNSGYPADVVKHTTASGFAGRTCSTATCHANVYGTGTVTTPVWGSTGNGCNACHTTPIGTTGPATGSHAIHNNTDCSQCHTGATNSATIPSANHADGNIDVNSGYPADVVKHTTASGFAGRTCSTATCHASPVAATLVVTPAWGTTGNGCAACHNGTNAITASGPNTGSHARHSTVACTSCHATGTTATTAPTFANGHNDGNIDVANVGYPTNKAKGTAGVSCSTSVCHGASSPAWGTTGALPVKDTCTTCHGTQTLTVTAANRVVIAPSDIAGTGTGKVSANAKTGAHETHLLYYNGLSAQGTQDSRCNDCHGALPTSGSHANGSSTPAFQGLAKPSGFTTSYNSGSCSVYCHNPAGTNGTLASANAGTGIAPLWTNANYIADGTLKTQANCGTCHKSPGDVGFTSSTDHSVNAMPLGIATDCAGCHGHNGGTDGAAGQQHMDGIKWGNGSCDACHGYPPLTATQLSARTGGAYANAKVEDYAGGAGHHSTHLLATVKASEGFTPCLPCHPSTFHNGGNGTVSKLFVNVNDAADLTFRFDETRSKRYTVATQSCSNVSCHYQPTPAWTFGGL